VNVFPKFVAEGEVRLPKLVDVAIACPESANKVEIPRAKNFDITETLDI
jgi:hypothetical protein